MPITVKHLKVSTVPDAGDDTLVEPSDWNADHTLTGLGTMAEQNANAVVITGGTISGVTIPASNVTGTLGVPNGGTGASTLTGYVKGAGTSALTAAATIPNTDITGLGTASTKDAGAALGVATLDAGGKVPVSELPAAVLGALSYQGTWDASTNTPTLTSSVGSKGYYYVVSVAGNTNLNGITDWLVGDWAVFNGSIWQKVDNTETVTSVNGQTGAVVLTTTNVAEGTNLYYTDARARGAISAGTGISYNSTTGVVTNAAPDQTVVLTGGTGISTSGTYPSFTVTNTAPDQTVALSSGTGISVTGTYPSFTVTNTAPSSGGTVTSVTGTAPVVSSGGNTPAISMPAATTSVNGYLTSTDWNTFNNKTSNTGTVTSVGGTGTINGITLTGTVTTSGNLTLGGTLSNVSLATQVTGNLPVTNLNSGTSASALTFWRGDGTWATPVGAGTVTSVGQTFTGGLISVSGSPITTTGTLALTVAGTSGGIPYFSSASTWASSAALAANALVVGGGAGAAPSTITTGTGVATALGVNTGSAGAFVVNGGALGTPSSGTLTNCTFPTLNQNTTGSAATLTTGRTIGMTGDVTWTSASFNGSANVTGTATIATVTAAKGGTGQTSYAVGDLLYASTTTALSKLADVATGNALISGGVGVAPSYGKIGLTTHISGTLAVGNGGTGVATLTGLAYGNGTSAFTAATAAQVVTVIGTTAVTNATNATNATYTAGGTSGSGGAIYENPTTIASNYTIGTNKNAMSAGPITINTGVTVTVPTGSVWVIV